MTTATVTATLDDGSTHELRIGYELIGDRGGRDWVVTPGGRFSRDYPGVRELATALADRGNHVLIGDRPNTGESDVCFAGSSESAMQAAFLAALLGKLVEPPWPDTVWIDSEIGRRSVRWPELAPIFHDWARTA
jgi:hypothetical protein